MCLLTDHMDCGVVSHKPAQLCSAIGPPLTYWRSRKYHVIPTLFKVTPEPIRLRLLAGGIEHVPSLRCQSPANCGVILYRSRLEVLPRLCGGPITKCRPSGRATLPFAERHGGHHRQGVRQTSHIKPTKFRYSASRRKPCSEAKRNGTNSMDTFTSSEARNLLLLGTSHFR